MEGISLGMILPSCDSAHRMIDRSQPQGLYEAADFIHSSQA
jgi:hypothetical protein